MARRIIPRLSRVMADTIVPSPKTNVAILLFQETNKVSWNAQYWRFYSTVYSDVSPRNSTYRATGQSHISNNYTLREKTPLEDRCDSESMQLKSEAGGSFENEIGKNISKKDKIKFLMSTLLSLKESKEEVYAALDAWVAWERLFPLNSLRIALVSLEKEQEWHRVIQVIKWILSKGQGNTHGIYTQLLKALDMDNRPEEAHNFWMKKIGTDLHSVPWTLCTLMISIYYRNNMLERLVKLFKGLESFDRKPPTKNVVRKVADAYELLGLLDEKERVMEKYTILFDEKPWKGKPNWKSKKALRAELKKSVEKNQISSTADGAETTLSGQKDTIDETRLSLQTQQSNSNGVIDVVRQLIQN